MSAIEVRQALSEHALFATLPADLLDRVADEVSINSYKLGEVILKMGEPGDGFYLIQSGKVRVVDDSGEGKPVSLALLKAGDSFGERSLLHDTQVSATVRAAGSIVVLKIGAEGFKALLERSPEIRSQMEEAASKQREFNFLKTQNLLAGLKPKEISALIEVIETISLEDGDALFHEEDPGDAMYFVREGRLKIIKESAGDSLLGFKKAGEILGEMSLVFDAPRSAGAFAAGPTTVLKLGREDFQSRIGDNNQITELLADQASRHLQQQQTIVAGAAGAGEERSEESSKVAGQVVVGRLKPVEGMFKRSYPFATAKSPELAGIACFAMIAEFFKRELDIDTLVERQLQSGTADDMYSLSRKAEGAGYLSRLMQLGEEDIRAVPLPAVVQSMSGEMAVVYRITRTTITLADPMRGITFVPYDEFLDNWDGSILSITYLPDFGAIGADVTKIYKQFLPLMRPYWPMVGRILGITVLLNIMALIPPFFTQILMDNVLLVGDWDLLVVLLIAILIGTLVAMVTGAVREFLTMHLMRRLTATLFIRFFGHILSLPLLYLKKWDTGALTARFEENEKVLEMASNGGLKIVMNTVSIIIYIPILFIMNWKLASLVLFISLCMGAIAVFCAPTMRRYEIEKFEAGAVKDSHVIEVVNGIGTIKALAQENDFSRKGAELFYKEQEIEYRSERFDNKMELGIEVLDQASDILVLGLGAFMVLQGQMTPGQLIAFSGVANNVTDPVEELADFYDEILELKIALDRLNDILGAPREAVQSEIICPPLTGNVRFENVNFKYTEDGPLILTDVNLEIKTGQKVAFVGRSGSGKSTLVRLVNRLLEPTDGTVFIDDIDVGRVDVATLRQQVGVVEQKPFIFSGTVRENIAKASPTLPFEAVVSASTLAGCHDFIDQFPMKYDTRIGEGGRSVSGGQKQRLIIARAIAPNPNILVLDEATSALDNESERIIQRNLDRIMKDRTTLVIAHRLSTIRDADMIVVLDEGKIAEKGTHDELMTKKGLYHYLATRTNV